MGAQKGLQTPTQLSWERVTRGRGDVISGSVVHARPCYLPTMLPHCCRKLGWKAEPEEWEQASRQGRRSHEDQVCLPQVNMGAYFPG